MASLLLSASTAAPLPSVQAPWSTLEPSELIAVRERHLSPTDAARPPEVYAVDMPKNDATAHSKWFADFIAAGATGADQQEWTWHHVNSSFFTDGRLAAVEAGSIIFCSQWSLSSPELASGANPEYLTGPSWVKYAPKLWALLNHSEPLQVMLVNAELTAD